MNWRYLWIQSVHQFLSMIAKILTFFHMFALQVIEDKIDLQLESKSKGVCMVGFYGTGGMGKTTICKALCNEFFIEFRGRVCHAELERMSEKELLRDVLRRLSNTRGEFLNGLNENEV